MAIVVSNGGGGRGGLARGQPYLGTRIVIETSGVSLEGLRWLLFRASTMNGREPLLDQEEFGFLLKVEFDAPNPPGSIGSVG